MGATLLGFRRIQTVTVVPETLTGLAEAWQFDCVMDMNETNPGQAYRHPLQNGQEGITDGTRLEPPEFQVDGILVDNPIRFLLPRPSQGAVSLYEQIKSIRERQIPVAVHTSWAGLLRNRWPETIGGKHGASDGASIGVSINFVRFRLVTTSLVPAQVDSDVLLLGLQTTTISQPAAP